MADVYAAPGGMKFRNRKGTMTDKVAADLDKYGRDYIELTAGGTKTSLAAAGIDLATGSDIQWYGVFVAPCDLTVIKMHDYITEVYAKNTTDAKIEVYDDAGSPNKIFGRTLAAGGEAAKAYHTTDPETGMSVVAAGTRLDLKAVNTGGSGTGHAVVWIEYIRRT